MRHRLELATPNTGNPPPPALYTTGPGVQLGTSTSRGISPVILPNSIRDRHVYIVGKTRTGKSTLVFNCALQDIEAGRGVAVIDPHGDLVEDLLRHIPESRAKDVIYFDATEREYPISLNPFCAETEDEMSMLADDMVLTVRRLSEAWGDRLDTILRYTFHTLLRSRGVSFVDVQTILQEPGFRDKIVRQLPEGVLSQFWRFQFPGMPKDAAQPILNRMSKFMLSPSLYSVLSQPSNGLNFFDIINRGQIVLVNLSQGKIGEDSAHLLGSLFVSQFQLATMRRARLSKSERIPYYLYVDEFQNFLSSPFDKILSEAGKYQLRLTLAHQYISQLNDQTRFAILGNVGTIIVFQLGDKDAQALRTELGTFQPPDIVNLSSADHEALCKPATRSMDTFKFTTLAPPPLPEQDFTAQIAEHTRQSYGQKLEPKRTTEKAAPPAPAVPPPGAVENERPPDDQPDDQPAVPRTSRPIAAPQVEFPTIKDAIIYHTTRAEYLSTAQIIELCFNHLSTEASKKTNASRALAELIEARKLKSQPFGKNKIYYPGRTPNPTTHNLAIRDLYVKICRSPYTITACQFYFDKIPGLTPDLYVEFASGDHSPIATFWEYDTGTEGVAELRKKLARYAVYPYDRLAFIVNTPERLTQLSNNLAGDRTCFAMLGAFANLDDPAFYKPGTEQPGEYFIFS